MEETPSGNDSHAATIARDSSILYYTLFHCFAMGVDHRCYSRLCTIPNMRLLHPSCASISSTPIGGQFTQIQAKAIDFALGAAVAPMVIAAANFLWFNMSRVTFLNEKCNGHTAVPLRALTEVASTSAGSYNIFKHFTLVKTYRLRLILFSLLALLSAIASTLLSNVIAYEVYHGKSHLRPVVMQSLRFNGALTRNDYEPELFLLNMMNTISYKNATSLLEKDNSYIAVNLTDASIANLSSSAIGLRDAAGYRVTISCLPAEINDFSLLGRSSPSSPDRFIGPEITIGDKIFYSYIPDDFTHTLDNRENFYDMVAFYTFQNSSWVAFTPKILLVTATRSDNPRLGTTHSSPSSFGDLPHHSFEADIGLPTAKGTAMEAWGVVCEINWQYGDMDMTRDLTGAWQRSRYSFGDPFVNIFSWLRVMDTPFAWHSPHMGGLNGLGGALAATAVTESKVCPPWGGCTPGTGLPGSKRTLNFTTFASNYLYISASLENFIFNLDLCEVCRDAGEYDVTVQAVFENLVYRITYIPGLVVFALVAIAAAASIPLGMFLYSRDSVMLRTGRVLNPLRLVFDCAEALKNANSLGTVANWGRARLAKLSDNLMVGYHLVDDDSGSRVKLSLESSWIGQDSTISREAGDESSQHLLESIDGGDEDIPLI